MKSCIEFMIAFITQHLLYHDCFQLSHRTTGSEPGKPSQLDDNESRIVAMLSEQFDSLPSTVDDDVSNNSSEHVVEDVDVKYNWVCCVFSC